MKRSGNNAVITVLAMFFGIGVICYAASRIDRTGNAVYVSAVPDTSTMIVLDAGHGGIDGGCSTSDGIPEKGINLDIMLSVRDMSVIFGYSTVTTRDTDMSIHDSDAEGIRAQKISDMENRLEIFNKFPDAVCLSIHQNTYTDPKFNGAQMFYSKTNPESAHLASIMQGLFKENLQPYNERETKLCGNELYLCHFCKNPAVMAECGFLSNPDEAAKLTNAEYRRQVAFTLFEGLNRFITDRKR